MSQPGVTKTEITDARGVPLGTPENPLSMTTSSAPTTPQAVELSDGAAYYVAAKDTSLLASNALLTAGNALLTSIDAQLASPIAVTGPLTDAQLRALAVPVSAASLPLPSGAATEATHCIDHTLCRIRQAHRRDAAKQTSTTELDIGDLDLRMEPGDVLAVAVTTASSTAVTDIAVNWQED